MRPTKNKPSDANVPKRVQSTVSSPFCLRERLQKYNTGIGIIPLAGVLLAAFLLYSMTSRYIYAPGLTFDLNPESTSEITETHFPSEGAELPTYPGRLEGKAAFALLTVRNNNMFIFDGRIYKDLTEALPPVPKSQAGTRGTLLVKLDKSNNVQGLFDLTKIARDAGFASLQLAGESARPNTAN